MKHFIKNEYSRAGFTLAEILLAMLVFSIAITTILALLARSIETVDDIVLRDEAMRLSSAVEQELSQLPFNDLYDKVRQSTLPNPVQLNVFHYRAVDDANRTPETDRSNANALILPFVTFRDNPQKTPFTQDNAFAARDGRFFRVLISVSPTNPQGTALPGSADQYQSAAIVLFARFIPLGGPNIPTPSGDPRSVYSYNFAVRR